MKKAMQVPEAAEVRDAFQLVDARLDAGDAFEARCRGSLVFARAVEEARLLRAYMPGVLRQRSADAELTAARAELDRAYAAVGACDCGPTRDRLETARVRVRAASWRLDRALGLRP